MDYMFGVMIKGSGENVNVSIYDNLKHCKEAAYDTMTMMAAIKAGELNITEALRIQEMAQNIEEQITEEFFEGLEKEADKSVCFFDSGSFIFGFYSMRGYRILAEDEDPTIEVLLGADHRNCTDNGCKQVPTAEMIKEGWVPWATTDS